MGILIAGVMIVSPLFYSPAYAQSDEEQLNIEDPELYYVKKYHSGDCVLCSNAYMIMRAAYYNGSEDFQKITNNLLRRYACTSKHGCIMKHDYKFTFDGVTYRIKAKSLSGKKSAKEKKLRDLLEEHPEGIVVRGAARSGGHGILLTSYEDGKFYAVDSAQNYHGRNKGIVEYDDTTMYSIKRLTQIWYIESQTGFPKSHIDDIALLKTTVKKTSKGWFIRWNKGDDKTKLEGYKITRISYQSLKLGGSYKKYATSAKKFITIKDLKNGKTYYFKIKGYITDPKGNVYETKTLRIKIRMSTPAKILDEENNDEGAPSLGSENEGQTGENSGGPGVESGEGSGDENGTSGNDGTGTSNDENSTATGESGTAAGDENGTAAEGGDTVQTPSDNGSETGTPADQSTEAPESGNDSSDKDSGDNGSNSENPDDHTSTSSGMISGGSAKP